MPRVVYNNLIKMMNYRGAILNSAALTNDEVVQQLNHHEMITINGSRPADDIRGKAAIVIMLIAPNSKYSNKSAEFKKLLKNIAKVKGDEALDVIFVSEEKLTVHIEKHLDAYRAENPKVHIETREYSLFLIEAPKHVSVPKHVLVEPEKFRAFCTKYHVSKELFPKINPDDTQAVWMGLRPGMVVMIYRMSETAGISIAFRVCSR